MRRPCRCSNASIIERGAAEPPTTIDLSRERSQPPGFASSACRMPSQIVGTPAVTVTRCSTKASSRLCGSRCGPGKTCFAPISVQANGKPHALAWNIGTTGRTTSASESGSAVAEQLRQRVDGDRAVRVDDALRAAGRPARVAHRGREPLVDVALLELVCARGRQQLLVVDRAVGRRSVADGDHVLEADTVLERLGQRPEHLVDEQDAVAGVLGDVGEVVGVEAKVERVRDHPAGGEPEVRLEVLVVVPAERPDAVAVAQPELLAQRDREPLRAVDEVGIGVGVPALVRQAGCKLPLGVKLLGPAHDRRDVQLVVHDQALHLTLPGRGGWTRSRPAAQSPRRPTTGSTMFACTGGGGGAPR